MPPKTMSGGDMGGYRSFGYLDDKSITESDYHDISSPKFKKRSVILNNSIIGNYSKFRGPFGEKPICYTDWTASGRMVDQIETYLHENVVPLYGNTHTTTSITGDSLIFITNSIFKSYYH